MNWIPVSERLPDDDEAVIVATKGSFSEPVWIGWHSPEGWYAVGVVGAAQIEVTHWGEFPEPPR